MLQSFIFRLTIMMLFKNRGDKAMPKMMAIPVLSIREIQW